jgi:hypothetical protein
MFNKQKRTISETTVFCKYNSLIWVLALWKQQILFIGHCVYYRKFLHFLKDIWRVSDKVTYNKVVYIYIYIYIYIIVHVNRASDIENGCKLVSSIKAFSLFKFVLYMYVCTYILVKRWIYLSINSDGLNINMTEIPTIKKCCIYDSPTLPTSPQPTVVGCEVCLGLIAVW